MRNSEFNEKELMNTIEKSKIEEKEKKDLKFLFSELIKHYSEFIKHIKKKIYDENKSEEIEKENEKNIEIYSILAPKNKEKDFEKYGFIKICENDVFLAEGMELDRKKEELYVVSKLYYTGKYFEKEKYLDKKYQAVAILQDKNGNQSKEEINFYLYDEEYENSEFHEKILKIDKIIDKYELESNHGFLPFKTRMFYTYFFNLNLKKIEEGLEIKKIDLQLEKNGLEEFRTDIIPMWNIKLENIKPRISTTVGEGKVDYNFILGDNGREKEFIISVREEEYEQILNGNNLNIISENKSEEFEKTTISPINRRKVEELEIKIYSNLSREGYYNKKQISRIRTKADIENFLKRYDNGYNIKNYEVSNKPLEMEHYFIEKFPTEENIFLPQYKCKLYIKFENDETDNLYVDYLKYILDELKKNYPEIHWIGGI